MDLVNIRKLEIKDNKAIAVIIREALKDFGADLPGTVYYDTATDDLHSIFKTPNSNYFVAIVDGNIVGGGGYFPTEGLNSDTCELVKMYINASFRGKGIGKMLLDQAIEHAIKDGFKYMYLETLPQLSLAVNMYKKYGFENLNGPLGNSGHFGCNMWMGREL